MASTATAVATATTSTPVNTAAEPDLMAAGPAECTSPYLSSLGAKADTCLAGDVAFQDNAEVPLADGLKRPA
jgi:hypothetical protein